MHAQNHAPVKNTSKAGPVHEKTNYILQPKGIYERTANRRYEVK
jgi:hypothetical protein